MKKLKTTTTILLTLLTIQPVFADNSTKEKTDIKPYCWFICPPDAADTSDEKSQ